MKKMAILLAAVVLAQAGFGKTVGICKGTRDLTTPGMVKTMVDAGWTQIDLSLKDLEDTNALAVADVLLFTGGWNDYYFPNYAARRALHGFVASGKGILSSGFRSGYTRTASRLLFPQVGGTYNRGNGSFLIGAGDSVLAKSISAPFSPGGWDHISLDVGPEGKVFATCAGDPVGAYGEIYGGRYIALGTFIGHSAVSNAMTGVERDLFLAMLNWLGTAPKRNAAGIAKAQEQADLDFLRREKTLDWTLNERGPGMGTGLLPAIHIRLAIPLESRLFTLEYMSQFLSGKQLDECLALTDELKKAASGLDGNFQKAMADMTSKIGKMSAEELLADDSVFNKSNVLAKIDALPGKTDEEKKNIKGSFGRNNEGNVAAAFLYGDEWSEKLMPSLKLKELTERAEKAIVGFRPLVKAAKAARLAKEHKQDLAAVPGLIGECTSPDIAVRQAAVMELGRIGDLKGAQALIGALADKDEKVRINAILGLGWMQAKEAVPALIKLLDGPDVLIKRRAAQALGQIGDARAIKPLMACLEDSDGYIKENATFSLGWLKAKDAVPELLKIVTPSENNKTAQWIKRNAISALGNIGDATALPVLETIRGTNAAYASEKTAKYYPTQDPINLERYAQLAIAAINAGGSVRPGIEQADYLAATDRFYALTKRFNALAGRPDFTRKIGFKDDWSSFLPYVKEAGFTGVHNAWGSGNVDPDKYYELLESAGDLDLIWVDVFPNGWNQALEKPAMAECFNNFRNVPAFAGFWFEETYPATSAGKGEFEPWFKAKYGEDPRKKFGLSDDAVIPTETGLLKTEYLQFCAEKMLVRWREAQEWMHGMRKGAAFTFSISHRSFAAYIGVTGPAGDVIDVNGPEIYQSFGRDNAFMMEMHKDGKARPVMCEFYNWYTPSAAHEVRGYAQHLMHGECFYNFALEQIFKYPLWYNWTWAGTRWDNVRTIFQKADRIKEYLAVPASAANVAQLCSEMTACQFNNGSPLGARWYQQQAALWTALQQSQIPADVIWTETLDPEKLARYRVIVMTDDKILTKEQVELIRDWVKQGGALIAGGSSSLFDFLPAVKKNYDLADVFGVDYAGFAGVTDSAKNDTICFQLDRPPLPVESSMALPSVRNHVHREFKPVKSIGVYKVAGGPALSGMAAGAACEYDMPLGYDKVKPGTAEVLATFANNDPAITLNKIDKGLCYFWTPIYPGLCYVGSEFENDANIKDFWQNSREVLAAMVRGGLAQQQATLPVDVTSVGLETEVTIRQQPEKNRIMVHLLNYDTKLDLVKSPKLTIHPPAGKAVKRIFYPDTDTVVAFEAAGNGVTATLRDYQVHDMVVVEWGGGSSK